MPVRAVRCLRKETAGGVAGVIRRCGVGGSGGSNGWVAVDVASWD